MQSNAFGNLNRDLNLGEREFSANFVGEVTVADFFGELAFAADFFGDVIVLTDFFGEVIVLTDFLGKEVVVGNFLDEVPEGILTDVPNEVLTCGKNSSFSSSFTSSKNPKPVLMSFAIVFGFSI